MDEALRAAITELQALQKSNLAELQALRAELKKSRLDKVREITKDLLVPILLGFLTYFAAQAANLVSEGHLKLANSEAANKRVEFSKTMQAKYFEIFYQDLNSGKPEKQISAVRLVRLFDTNFADQLLQVVLATPGLSPAAQTLANETRKEIQSVGALLNFKIGVYFYKNEARSAESAKKYLDRIRAAGFKGDIQTFPSSEIFMQSMVAPRELQVRYDAGSEEEAAEELLRIVQSSDAVGKWKKYTVTTPTPRFISIFIPKDGG